MRKLLIAIMAAALVLSACDSKPKEDAAAETTAAAEAPAEEAAAEEAEPAAEDEAAPAEGDPKVVVAAAGTSFDPPVEKSQIPEGAYICDMGTVHFARMEKGDGKCPECGMMLKMHGTPKAADAPAEDGHGHDHGDHAGHDH